LRGKIQCEIALAARDDLGGVGIRGRLEIANIGQAFDAQQFLGGVLWGKTNARIAHHSDGARLRLSFCCKCRRRVDEAGRAG
jgi:hypothetical protein